MSTPSKLPAKDYKKFIAQMPIVCVDGVLIRNKEVLLVKRKNEPLKGDWWIPGGRVRKGEKLNVAFRRIMKEEVGVDVLQAKFMGFIDFWNDKSEWDTPTHSVSLVFMAMVPDDYVVTLDTQATELKWAKELPKEIQIWTK